MTRSLNVTSLGGLPIQIDPTARDFASALAALIELVQDLTPEWTDFSPFDPGVSLLESNAYSVDLLSYLLDRVLNEGFLLTAQQRQSVVDILRLINYELAGATASQVAMVVQVDSNTTLPAGYAVRSIASALTPSLRFELLNSVNLPNAGYWTTTENAAALGAAVGAGNVYVNDGLVFVHGTSVEGEALGTSDGSAGQRYTLANTGFTLNPDGTSPLAVYVAAGAWTQVDSFLSSEPTDEVYRVEVDGDGTVEIIFSDGASGKIPPSSSAITADYRIGGGEIGNSVGVAALATEVAPEAGVVQLYNPVQPSGGTDAETIEHAKVYGPLSLRALDRAVTLEDFETLAVQVAGISSARAAHVESPYDVTVYVAATGANPVPAGAWYPDIDTGTGLIGTVGRYLSERKVAGTRMNVEPPTVVRPYLRATVRVLPNFLREDAETTLKDRLRDYFQSLAGDFGRGVPQSRIAQLIENTRAVDSVEIQQFHRLPAARFVKGNDTAFTLAVLTVEDIAPQVRYERYTIRWLNSQVYEMRGARSGRVVDSSGVARQFTESVDYEINHYQTGDDTVAPRVPQFTINIATGATAPSVGDEWLLIVDTYDGSIALDPFEMLVPTVDTSGNLSADEFELSFSGGIGG